MVRASAGTIAMVSSEAGLRGSAAGTVYTTSKHAVNSFMRSTTFFSVPAGIRCNAVAPGAVATSVEARFRSLYAGDRLGPYLQTNVPPIAPAGQLAAAVTWLLSDDWANVTREVPPSGGGWCTT
ncbi:SDR family NAD(P)-dependent oxidoreductase [Curtobacterium sp. TC1]|nr:SDR family NAD(P)-dependent oxidoreductase [Curtobacterium sp. TC1]